MSDQKNLLIAIVASILIMVSFQYFVERPKMEAIQARQQEAAKTTTPGRAQPKAPQTAPGQTPTPTAQSQPDIQLPSAPATTPGTAASQAVPPGGPVTPPSGPVIQGPRVTLTVGIHCAQGGADRRFDLEGLSRNHRP
jgi:hypothetical protein